MRSVYCCLLLSIVVMTVFSVTVIASERIKTFTFEGINSVNIQTVSGNIRICSGNESELVVELKNDLEKPEMLSPEVKEDNGELSIEEHFRGNNVRGEIFWTVYVPPLAILKTIKCHSASGDMQFERIKVDFIKTESASGNVAVDSFHAREFEFSTASGSISVKDCGVDFIDANSASGDISFNSVIAKELKLSVASGSITVEDCDIEELGELSSASGDVELFLPDLPSERLEASSASGDVVLKVPQFGENFSMTIEKRAGKGRVKCPFEFTEKETIRYHENDDYPRDRYLVKRGKGKPEIALKTASGTIRIQTANKGK
jgi:DUF4097 and DUF4098 domain-containing protein YvlB